MIDHPVCFFNINRVSQAAVPSYRNICYTRSIVHDTGPQLIHQVWHQNAPSASKEQAYTGLPLFTL